MDEKTLFWLVLFITILAIIFCFPEQTLALFAWWLLELNSWIHMVREAAGFPVPPLHTI